MRGPYRSRRAEVAHLREEMLAHGATAADIAEAIRARYRVGSRTAFRLAHGLTQQQVADIWNVLWPADHDAVLLTHKHLSYWEAWPAKTGRAPTLDALNRLARIYRCRAEDLVDGEDHTGTGGHVTTDLAARALSILPARLSTASLGHATVGPLSDDEGGATNRRDFALTAALAALGISDSLHLLSQLGHRRLAVGDDHVALATSIIGRIERADAAIGGDILLDFAIGLHARLSQWLATATCSRVTGDALQAALGDLKAWMGWLAFDAGQKAQSRQFLQDTILHARLLDDPALEVRALVYLSLVVRQERPRESLQCVEAAQRIAAAWATPRLQCLLQLRAAHASAEQADAAGVRRHMSKAVTELDRGPHRDDPAYLLFVTPQEVRGIEGLSYLALSQADRATAAFNAVIDQPDPAYQRNRAYYTVQLANATRLQGDTTGAARIASQAVPAVVAMRSGRTSKNLAQLRSDLLASAPSSPAVREFVDLYDDAAVR